MKFNIKYTVTYRYNESVAFKVLRHIYEYVSECW